MNNIQLYDLNKQEIRCNDPIQMTANLIKLGYIVAIKGLGGYHLCCNAKDEEAVRRLRIKKQRKDKPLAIMAKDINCFKSSSMGRLFDCVCAIVGLRREITYDAQGAIELESQIAQGIDDYYYYDIADQESIVLKYDKVLRGIIDDVKSGVCIPVISAKFHNTIIIATVECVIKIRERTSLNKVVLSGGVFENIYLLQNIYLRLREEGFNVYFNKIVPINDGGISYGQLIVGTQLAKEGNYVCCNSSKDC